MQYVIVVECLGPGISGFRGRNESKVHANAEVIASATHILNVTCSMCSIMQDLTVCHKRRHLINIYIN